MLTHKLLEEDPNTYLDIISKIDEFPGIDDKIHETWYSNHVQSLSYLVGTLNCDYIDGYYGSNVDHFDEEIGIKILHQLIRLGADLTSENYYGNDILKELNKEGFFKRSNNEKFIEEVEKYYYNENKVLK